jgi:hypothetical protein
MTTKWIIPIVLAAAAASGQQLTHKVTLPKDSPVALISDDWGDSGASRAFALDLHVALSLRNTSPRHIRGITLTVIAQEMTAGGKASISVPSLDIAPGDNFAVRSDLHLLRPLGTGGPQVEVSLDGVLFDDLSFYGPDKLHSRRSMTVWEMEARRDRKYFKSLLETAGRDGLQKEMLDALTRQADRPQFGGRIVPGRATNNDSEREVQFAFLQLPDSPIEPSDGMARIAGSEARAPRLQVRNKSTRPIRHLEIGWIVKDQRGRETVAASLPADVTLDPGHSSQIVQEASLRFPQGTSIQSMSGFVASVEFADGSFWVPSRTAIGSANLRRMVAPSPEEERLLQIYRKKGLDGLVEELKKF